MAVWKSNITHANVELASLVGTPRQVIWAEEIRTETLGKIEMRVQGILERNRMTDPDAARQRGGKIIEYLATRADASFWIENRQEDFAKLATQQIR